MRTILFVLTLAVSFSTSWADGLRVGTLSYLHGPVFLNGGGKNWRELQQNEVNHLDLYSGQSIAVREGSLLKVTRKGQTRTYGPHAHHYQLELELTPQEQKDEQLVLNGAHSAAKRKGIPPILWPTLEVPCSALDFQIFVSDPSAPTLAVDIQSIDGTSVYKGVLKRTSLGGYSDPQLVQELSKVSDSAPEELLLTSDRNEEPIRVHLLDSKKDATLHNGLQSNPSDTFEGLLARIKMLIGARQWALAAALAQSGGRPFAALVAVLEDAGYFRPILHRNR